MKRYLYRWNSPYFRSNMGCRSLIALVYDTLTLYRVLPGVFMCWLLYAYTWKHTLQNLTWMHTLRSGIYYLWSICERINNFVNFRYQLNGQKAETRYGRQTYRTPTLHTRSQIKTGWLMQVKKLSFLVAVRIFTTALINT